MPDIVSMHNGSFKIIASLLSQFRGLSRGCWLRILVVCLSTFSYLKISASCYFAHFFLDFLLNRFLGIVGGDWLLLLVVTANYFAFSFFFIH